MCRMGNLGFQSIFLSFFSVLFECQLFFLGNTVPCADICSVCLSFSFYILFKNSVVNSASPGMCASACVSATRPVPVRVLRETQKGGDTGDTACPTGVALEG